MHAITAMRDPQTCDECGYTCEAEAVPMVEVLAAVFSPPDDAEPAEHLPECPHCLARETFQSAIVCAECNERPRNDERDCMCDPAWLRKLVEGTGQ